MQFLVRLNHAPCCFILPVKAENAPLRLTGRDASHPYTKYFDRQLSPSGSFTGTKVFQLPMPVSPKVLQITLMNEALKNDSGIKLLAPELGVLEKRDLWQSKSTREFVDFAIDFASKAGYLKPGLYSSPDEKIVLYYSDNIIHKATGGVLFTPARVNRVTGIMECSRQKFLHYTIPMRVLILLHERMHYEQNTREEIEADLNALRIYLAHGFPKTEAIYATTKIFYDREDMIERVKQMMQFIYDFN